MNRRIVLACLLVAGMLMLGPATGHRTTPQADNGTDNAEQGGMSMQPAENGMVVNGGSSPPKACSGVVAARSITVRAGRTQAGPGEMFAYDTDVLRVQPCTRLEVTFVNEDHVRHQWMIHGLPTPRYPMGMFSIESTGPGRLTGTFVTPAEPGSYLIHCSLPQHEQKGMHAQLVVGAEGSQSVARPSPSWLVWAVLGVVLGGILVVALLSLRRAGRLP